MKQQRLLPYFFVTREFNCLFLFGESAYVNYAPLCLRKIRVKNIFQHKHKHFDRMQTWEVYRPTNPHLSALPLAHRRKLNICLFSPLLLQNLASLSNFSFFFFFFFWSGLGFPRHSRIQFTLCVFFSREPNPSHAEDFGIAAAGLEAWPKPLRNAPQSSLAPIDETVALTHVLSCRVAWLKCTTLENISALHPLK